MKSYQKNFTPVFYYGWKDFKENGEYTPKFDCFECKKPINDPVCPQCLADEFISWLDNYPQLKRKKEVIAQVNDFINKNKILEQNAGRCVACEKEKVYLCPYCFTSFLQTIVENNLGKKMQKEFLRLFSLRN